MNDYLNKSIEKIETTAEFFKPYNFCLEHITDFCSYEERLEDTGGLRNYLCGIQYIRHRSVQFIRQTPQVRLFSLFFGGKTLNKAVETYEFLIKNKKRAGSKPYSFISG